MSLLKENFFVNKTKQCYCLGRLIDITTQRRVVKQRMLVIEIIFLLQAFFICAHIGFRLALQFIKKHKKYAVSDAIFVIKKMLLF